jgi:hypothetical protein
MACQPISGLVEGPGQLNPGQVFQLDGRTMIVRAVMGQDFMQFRGGEVQMAHAVQVEPWELPAYSTANTKPGAIGPAAQTATRV